MPSNKNVIKIILLIISLTLTISSNTKRKSFKELIDKYLGKLDINNAYLSYDQYISLLNTLVKDFPNYLELSSIGKTYEGNEMPLIIMKSPYSNLMKEDKNTEEINDINKNSTNSNETYNIDISLYNKSGVLFDGMHHGREPVSMMMNIYLILHLLSLPKTYLHLFLSTTNIYFIPIINIDTYKYNSKKYLSGTPLRYVMARKNRRPHKTIKCNSDDIGIDLNRNYDYFFGKDNEGSSNRPCNEDYRGEYPFSEPEIMNMKKFVDSHPNIKIVYNYHSWGNLLITPFNYIKKEESLKIIKKDFPLHYQMYEDFRKEGQFPKNFVFGNADEAIKYLTNGDATDWFLGKKKILSFSPELGSGNKNSDVFYPDRKVTFEVLESNLYGGLYAIQKSMYYLDAQLISAKYSPCKYKNKYSFSDIYYNRGRIYQNGNLRESEINNCYSDELVLNIKVNITNKGFGDYIPGVEFPYIQQQQKYNKKKKKNENKKYFYFLAFDLKIELDKIKNLCFWNTLKTLYTIEKNDKDNNNNQSKKEPDETQYIGKIRCTAINKNDDLNDIKIFIDNEIKSMEFIILNLQIIVKKDSFLEKIGKNKNRFLDLNNNNKTISHNNGSEIIKIYTKNDRIVKSETYNGEIMQWKFNNPVVNIYTGDFGENKNVSFKNERKINPYKIIIILICATFLMIFIIYRILKVINARPFHEALVESVNDRSNENNNNNISFNMGFNNEQVVNNLENANQNDNINNEPIQPVQIPRDENESHSNTNSHSEIPNELNP